jgi:hypothetical protein
MPITIYPGTVKKRNLNGTYSDLVPGADANPQLANDIAEEYDPVAGVYSVGDYCIYQSVLYKCITAISTPEAFDSTKWADVSVTDEIGGVKNTLTQLETEIGIVVDGKSCALGASQGQYVILKNSTISGKTDGLYTAAQAIPAGEQNVTAAMLSNPISGGGLNSLVNSLKWVKIKEPLNNNETFRLVGYNEYLIELVFSSIIVATAVVADANIPISLKFITSSNAQKEAYYNASNYQWAISSDCTATIYAR